MSDTQPTAQLPTSHSALLYAVSLFCAPEWQHSERRRYALSEMRLEGGADRTIELIDLLRQSWGLKASSRLWGDAFEQVYKQMECLDALELHTRTYSATPQQTLWVLLAFDVMPALGRTWGFWCQNEALLHQMPEVDLWFLPHQDPANPDRLILPVEKVLSWWLEKFDGPLDRLWGEYDDERRRTLDNWKSGRTTPALSKIMEWFSDDYQFSYKSSDEAHLSTTQLRSLLLWARAIEQAYKDLVGFLTPGVVPNDADPMRNKALQLIELFRWSHEATLASRDPSEKRERMKFSNSFPEWGKNSVFSAITPDHRGHLPAPEDIGRFLSLMLRSLPNETDLPDLFDNLNARAPKMWMPNLERLGGREAVQSAIANVREIWEGDDPTRHFFVASGLVKLRKMPCVHEFEPDLAYLCALHALSSGNFDEARQHAEKALELCLTRSIGPLKLDIAKLNFSLAFAQDAFNRGSAERSFRIFCKSVQLDDAKRWKIDGETPIDYSMRLAAADHAAWFWHDIVRPYEGVEIDTPLQENSEIIRAYVGLLCSGASEVEVRAFKKKFGGQLKRKLRDVRGDTFFTVTSKMVPDLVRWVRQMPTNSGIPKEPSEANSMAATHLKLVSLLPTDVLDARDYLKQTALMLAADRNDVDMVKALIDRHVDIDAQDALGRTALHSAAKVGADRCFEILLAAGANPTLQTYTGKTPAIFAAEFGRATIFEMRLACTAYQMGRTELEEVHKLAQESAENFKAKRKAYAIQGYEIAGRKGFQRIAALALEMLDE